MYKYHSYSLHMRSKNIIEVVCTMYLGRYIYYIYNCKRVSDYYIFVKENTYNSNICVYKDFKWYIKHTGVTKVLENRKLDGQMYKFRYSRVTPMMNIIINTM